MLTSKDLAELFAETPPCETSELAKNEAGRGFQPFSGVNNDAKLAKLLNEDNPTTSLISHVSQSCELVGELTYKPFLATSQTSPRGIAANDDELMTDEAAEFWSTFLARVTECDELINSLCDLRGDDDARRADLLAVRKRMAPQRVDGDILYLKAEIATLTPAPPAEPERADCVPQNERTRFLHWRKT